ncbi:MAG: phosphatase PAP2 family protein, partial [Candidatus Acidiferrales bacterium]
MRRIHTGSRSLIAVIVFSAAMVNASALHAQEATSQGSSSPVATPGAVETRFAAPALIFPANTYRMPAPKPAFRVGAPAFSAPAFSGAGPRAAYVQDAATGQRDVSWRLLQSNFLDDQRTMWLFPVQLAHGHHWLPTISIVGITAGLIAADPHDAPYFRRTTAFSDFNNGFSSIITGAELAAAPGLTYVVGLIDKDSYAQKTALFAGEAAADGMVFYGIAQVATHRQRPLEIDPHGDFSDTFWDGHRSVISNSFPSGHSVAAFAIASVFSRRYRRHRWVPI